MSATRHIRRALTLAATAALLAMTACVPAATAADTAAKTPGWRVIQTVGPDLRPVYGLLTAVSAGSAWSAWSGSILTVEHWAHGAWHQVTIAPNIAPAAESAISIGAGPAGEVWLFTGLYSAGAIRHTGGKWVLQRIPRWVLRPGPGTISGTTTAVFGPRDVWVFSLGAGTAHYDGHAWAKVRMPEVPDGVSAAAAGDIWTLGRNIGFVMHWNGTKWVKVALPVLPLPKGATVSYSNVTAVGPHDAWVMRTITSKSGTTDTAMMHWNGKAWLTVASPADVVGSLVPDGHGGLWAAGIDTSPGGFWNIYHLAGHHWTKFTPPGVNIHSPEQLTWIPGTRSVWATASNRTVKSYNGVILKYGP